MKRAAFCMAILAVFLTSAPAQPDPAYEAFVPMRAITEGPKAHWFGYYDKHQFDLSDRYVLGMETDFEGRTPNPDDTIRLGVIDIEDGDNWREIAETKAWSWQQGCMLQWLPGSDSEVIYNDRDGDQFISVVLNVFSGEKRVLPRAIYAVSPDGTKGVGLNFARVDFTRPGYGYKGGVDKYAGDFAPDEEGIYAIDLKTGEYQEIVTLGQVKRIPMESEPLGKHWFNHLLFNTDGSRFIFLHRAKWEADGGRGWCTRMFTANPDGTDLHVVNDHNMVSHFIWHDPNHIMAWAREPDEGSHFWYYTDESDEKKIIGEGVLTRDGHNTYSPDGAWVLVDEYPDKDRMQALKLYRPSDGTLVRLGRFYLTRDASGEFRCDLHPRWSRSGDYITIDSMHDGDQRQIYLFDVSDVTGDVAKGVPAMREEFIAQLDAMMEKYEIPGITAAIALPGGMTMQFARGYADRVSETPMHVEHRMLAGSIGKTFVAATALAMAKDGKIDLDAPIAPLMKDYAWYERMPNGEKITMRHLLSHSAGLKDHVYEESFGEAIGAMLANAATDPDTYLKPSEQIAHILDKEPLFDAGEGYSYTDSGYLLAGLVIEKVAGRGYYEEMADRFLKPLNLADTAPSNKRQLDNLATGHLPEKNQFGLPTSNVVNGELIINPAIEWTGGGLVSKPYDLVRWAQALYGGHAIEGDYVDDILGSGYREEGNDSAYGLGCSIRYTDLGPVYGHGGWFPGYSSELMYAADYGCAVAVQINTDGKAPPARVRMQLLETVVNHLKE